MPFSAVDEDLVGAYPTPAGERRFTAVDDELIRAYRQSPASRVQLYVGYYRRQEEGKELTGDAGRVLQTAATRLVLSTESGPRTISEVVAENGGTRRGIIFWYDVDGRVIPDIYGVKAYTIVDGILHQRSNGAVIMIAWEGPAGAQSDARKRAIEFAQALMPVLRSHFPS
jgi:EpsI family protein